MNDPDRRQTSDGFNNDAVFADIVAHWSDTAPEPEPATRPARDELAKSERTGDDLASDEAAHDETVGVEASDSERAGDEASGTEDREETADDGTADQLPAVHYQWPADPPPVLPTPSQQAIPAPQAWRAHDVDDSYEEHFEPPPIAPLPVGDLQFWGIIAGMCGGPLLLLYLVLFNRDAGGYWMLTAIAMSVGGFALLVSRLPRDHEDDDDGARL